MAPATSNAYLTGWSASAQRAVTTATGLPLAVVRSTPAISSNSPCCAVSPSQSRWSVSTDSWFAATAARWPCARSCSSAARSRTNARAVSASVGVGLGVAVGESVGDRVGVAVAVGDGDSVGVSSADSLQPAAPPASARTTLRRASPCCTFRRSENYSAARARQTIAASPWAVSASRGVSSMSCFVLPYTAALCKRCSARVAARRNARISGREASGAENQSATASPEAETALGSWTHRSPNSSSCWRRTCPRWERKSRPRNVRTREPPAVSISR